MLEERGSPLSRLMAVTSDLARVFGSKNALGEKEHCTDSGISQGTLQLPGVLAVPGGEL